MKPAEERTHRPTEARRRRAREAGRTARSRDLTGALALLASLILLDRAGGALLSRLSASTRHLLASAGARELDPAMVPRLMGEAFSGAAALALPIGAAVWSIALLGGMAQTGFLLDGGAVLPRWHRVSPLSGASRLFSLEAAARGVFALLKVAAITWLLIRGARLFLAKGELAPAALLALPVGEAVPAVADRLLGLGIEAAALLLVLAALDWCFQRRRLERELFMTRQEVLDERKEHEMNPEVKRRGARQRKRLLGPEVEGRRGGRS